MKITRESSTRTYLRRVLLKEFLDVWAVPTLGVHVPFTCYRRCLACAETDLYAIQRFVSCCNCIASRVRIPLSRLLARSFGLLLGGEPIDDGTLFGTVGRSMQFVVQGREFHVRLKPVGIVFDDPFQLLGGGFVFA
jgi:hypothetical protein